jgi:hypothetical protein
LFGVTWKEREPIMKVHDYLLLSNSVAVYEAEEL